MQNKSIDNERQGNYIMSVVDIHKFKIEKRFNKLLKEYADELMNEKPNNGFKAISIYKGWQYDAPSWLLLRLDLEVHRNNDLIKINDIKHSYPCNQLHISYISIKGNNYDELIDNLANLDSRT